MAQAYSIGGFISAHTLSDMVTGKEIKLSELANGGGEGTTGPKGDKGDTGPTGLKGDKGDTGNAGATGTAGVGIKTITAAQAGGVVTLTITLTDNSVQSPTFTLPEA